MFQFPAFAPVYRCHLFKVTGCPIRKSADQRAFAPPRGLSQLVTSFLASESPGIPRTLLLDFLVSSFNCIYSSVSLQTFSTFDSVTAHFHGPQSRSLICLFSPICQRSLESAGINLVRISTVENNGFEPLTPCLQSKCSTS